MDQESHKNSAESYSDRLDSVLDWVWEIDAGFNIVYSNAAVERILGYRVDEVIGRNIIDILKPVDPEICLEHLNTAFTTGAAVINDRFSVHHKDGRVVCLQTSFSPEIDESGVFCGCRGVSSDVTRIMELESAALEALNNYRVVVEQSPSGIFIVQDGKVVFGNPRITELTGYTLDDVMGVDVTGFIHPSDRERVMKAYTARIAGQPAPEHYEYKALTKSGRLRYFEIRPTRIQYNGAPAVLANVIDVTDRRLAEEALRESEEKYKTLLDTTGTGYVIIDTKGRVLDANQEYVSLTGRSSVDDIMGHTIFEWIAPYDIQRNREGIQRLASESGTRKNVEVDYIDPDGEILPVEVNASTVNTRRGTLIIALARNIRERKQAEEDRRRMQAEMELQKKQFYRETLLSITEGKLDVCERPELDVYFANADHIINVSSASDVADARKGVVAYLDEHGLSGERLDMFIVAVGEAITNAVKHGVKGRVFMGSTDDCVWMGVSDEGPGIESLILPRVTLLRGFSTKPSLGLGYTIMLEIADHLKLSTDQHGTTIILLKSKEPAEVEYSVEKIPDLW